jgi:hypothetical protein
MTTGEQVIQDLLHPHIEAMNACRITPLYLAKKHKEELNAKITKTLKIKGTISECDQNKGVKKIATSGLVMKMGDGERDYSDGETVIAWDEVDWGTRQRARMDAQKLLNLYPTEKLEIVGQPLIVVRDAANRESTTD